MRCLMNRLKQLLFRFLIGSLYSKPHYRFHSHSVYFPDVRLPQLGMTTGGGFFSDCLVGSGMCSASVHPIINHYAPQWQLLSMKSQLSKFDRWRKYCDQNKLLIVVNCKQGYLDSLSNKLKMLKCVACEVNWRLTCNWLEMFSGFKKMWAVKPRRMVVL